MTNPKSARQQWEEEMVQSGIGIIDELGNFAITRQKNLEWNDTWESSVKIIGNCFFILKRDKKNVEIPKYLPIKMYEYERKQYALQKDLEYYQSIKGD